MIFGLIKRNSGPCFHRIHVPLMLMRNTDVFITNGATEELFEKKKPTTVFYNRSISDEVLKLQTKYQFKIVVDVDDYWHLDPTHILYEYHYANRINEHYEKHIRLADVVTTTHERLAEKIYKLNRNVVILPNAIPKNCEYFNYEYWPSSNHFIRRVFWQGSVTHIHDINLLRNPFKRLDKNKFLMVMAGYMQNETAWDYMVDAYTSGCRLKGSILQGTAPYHYYYNYSYADVCVAPLVNNSFNIFKSNLKVLEAAHAGLPCIASNVHPYKDVNGLMYVNKQNDWYKWLNASKEELMFNAGLLKEWADKNHNFESINEKRNSILL